MYVSNSFMNLHLHIEKDSNFRQIEILNEIIHFGLKLFYDKLILSLYLAQ